MIYIIVLLLLVFLSLHYDIKGKTMYRDECYFAMLVVFILIAGLRWRLMVDTPNYIYGFYHEYPPLKDFSFEDFQIGQDPFYVLINSFVKSIGGRFYWVQLIEATFVNTLVFKYFKRHSDYIFTCIFFYAISCYPGYSMETMRASFTFVLCLFANDFFLEKKWIKGYLLLLLALMFHAQMIVMFVVPILFFMRMNKLTVFLLVGVFIFGYVVQKTIGTYLDMIDFGDDIMYKATKYSESEKYATQRGNLNFMIVFIFPNIFYSLFCVFYLKKYHPKSSVLKLEPFIMCGVFFLILQMNMQIAYRYVDYFRIYFNLFFAETFIKIILHSKNLNRSIATWSAVAIFLPFFLITSYSKYLRLYTLYPYSSVIERRIDREREKQYQIGDHPRPRANINEY